MPRGGVMAARQGLSLQTDVRIIPAQPEFFFERREDFKKLLSFLLLALRSAASPAI